MIKIPEYMAMGRAVASYDLPESRVSAADGALYATPGDPDDLGRVVAQLLDDGGARRRWEDSAASVSTPSGLAWRHSEAVLLQAYAHVLGRVPV